ncbi:MAG: methyltransferase domain-containing protein [Pseudomonadota bacterium]
MTDPAWDDENQSMVEHFSSLVERYGIDHRSLDWGSRESQELRFDAMCAMGDLQGSTILDVGCGTGDFLDYLTRRGIELDYTGYDIAPAMIDLAKRRFPGARFAVRDLHGQVEERGGFDYVMASGIFSLRKVRPFEFMAAMVRKMFQRCRKGAAFNSLSTSASRKVPGEFYCNPGDALRMCLSLSPRVLLRHDYLPHDFTVFLYR